MLLWELGGTGLLSRKKWIFGQKLLVKNLISAVSVLISFKWNQCLFVHFLHPVTLHKFSYRGQEGKNGKKIPETRKKVKLRTSISAIFLAPASVMLLFETDPQIQDG